MPSDSRNYINTSMNHIAAAAKAVYNKAILEEGYTYNENFSNHSRWSC